MANELTQPTEEQIMAANQAQDAKWQGDFKEEDLSIPYKRETEETPKKEDVPKPGEDEQVTEVISEPEPVVTAQDPGEYQPADYSFEVTLKDGKTVKIATPEEADKVSEDPDNFETPKQLLDFIKKSTQMQSKLDKDYDEWEKKSTTFKSQLEVETQRRETVDNFTNEMLYLVEKGLIPDIEDADAKKRWLTDETASLDKEFVKTPGVREQTQLLNYLVKENERRSKSNVRQLTSLIDAFNAWKVDTVEQEKAERLKQAEQAKREAGEARKAAGARVAGVSPSQQGSYVPKGIAVGNPNVFKRGSAVWDN